MDTNVTKRLDLIEEAIKDYKAGKLSPIAALTAISMVVNPGEIGEKELGWAKSAIAKLNKQTTRFLVP
jgi:hypothetical protein